MQETLHSSFARVPSATCSHLDRPSQLDSVSCGWGRFSWFDSAGERRPAPLHLLAHVSDICEREAAKPTAAGSVCASLDLLLVQLPLPASVLFPLAVLGFASGTEKTDSLAWHLQVSILILILYNNLSITRLFAKHSATTGYKDYYASLCSILKHFYSNLGTAKMHWEVPLKIFTNSSLSNKPSKIFYLLDRSYFQQEWALTTLGGGIQVCLVLYLHIIGFIHFSPSFLSPTERPVQWEKTVKIIWLSVYITLKGRTDFPSLN